MMTRHCILSVAAAAAALAVVAAAVAVAPSVFASVCKAFVGVLMGMCSRTLALSPCPVCQTKGRAAQRLFMSLTHTQSRTHTNARTCVHLFAVHV